MKYQLIIEDFGKIKRAEIQVFPFTLFVGDNNSGKSYLLSLLWALQSSEHNSLLFRGLEECENYHKIHNILKQFVDNTDTKNFNEIHLNAKDIMEIFNELLQQNKDIFISSIFNYKEINIGKLEIRLEKNTDFTIKISQINKNAIGYMFYINDMVIAIPSEISNDNIVRVFVELVLRWIIDSSRDIVYLPAARTGFVLAKDVINKVGRKKTFDLINFDSNENEPGDMQPFTKPIIHFLDVLDELSIDTKNENSELVKWIETNMSKGNIHYTDVNNKEIRYFPMGSSESLPLRATSAVVTELTPLILLLKYKSYIKTICYEEPEMCLHPELQLEMAKLLIRLTNSNISIIASTHSDIILQHVNNMCKIQALGNPKQLLKDYNLSENDSIDINKVTVYQLTDHGNYSSVEKISATKDGFDVPTFSNALINILNQTSGIQDFDNEQED